MKRRILIGLMLCLACCCLCIGAMAASDPLTVSMDLSQNKFTTTKTITVSIKVSNVGEGDMPGPVTLYYPNGKQVEEFGSPTLAVGASQSWTGEWAVTQKQLEAGKITFKIKYSVYDEESQELVNKTKNFSKAITYTGDTAEAQIEINRIISPTIAEKGQEVTVTYDVINSGTVDVTDVTIKENSSVSKTSGTIASVAAGEKASYTFTFTMGSKNVTSQATITYKVNGKTQSTKKEATAIQYGEVDLSASLAADKKGGTAGEIVKLTLTLKNEGKVNFTNLKVTDPTLGDVFTNITLKAGETQTLTREITLAESADYLFTVTATGENELQTSVSTSKVSVTLVSAEDEVNLSVSAESDRDTIYSLPGTVKFTVTVTNNGVNEVKDVDVTASGVQLYNFPTVAAGESRSFTRDVSVSMAGQYQFAATCLDLLQQEVSFTSNIIAIAYTEPTAEPTEVPIVTPPAPVYVDIPDEDGLPEYVDTVQKTLSVVEIVCLVLGAVSLLLLLIGLIRRAQQKAQSNKAYDHLERGSYRDYSTPAVKEKGKSQKQKAPGGDAPSGDGSDEEVPADALDGAEDAAAYYAEDETANLGAVEDASADSAIYTDSPIYADSITDGGIGEDAFPEADAPSDDENFSPESTAEKVPHAGSRRARHSVPAEDGTVGGDALSMEIPNGDVSEGAPAGTTDTEAEDASSYTARRRRARHQSE